MQLDIATKGRGGIAPFIGICIIAAAFGVADGHVQGGMTGDLSLMCPEFIQVSLDKNIFLGKIQETQLDFCKCTLCVNPFYYFQSFFAGLAASGAITSALRLVTKAAFESSRDGLRKGASMLRQLLIKLHLHPFTSSDMYLIELQFMQCSSPQ